MRRSVGILMTSLFLFFIFRASSAFAQELLSAFFLTDLPKVWTKIDPRPTFFMKRYIRPQCSGGPVCRGWPSSCGPAETKFSFFVKGGTLNNLLVFFNGGGACWDSMNCLYYTTYSKAIYTTADHLRQFKGIFDTGDPSNPFRDWNFVFIPYCTGDLHWGSKDKEYPDHLDKFNGETFTIHHRGFDNFLAVLKWMKENLKGQDKIFVTGSSAGSYGAILGFPYIQEAFPASEVSLLGDAGMGVFSEDFKNETLENWGFQSNLPTWIPGLNRPFSEYTVANLYRKIADYYSSRRFAQYTTAWDSLQIFFYNISLNIHEPIKWLQWEDVECDGHDQMVDHLLSAAGASNYRYYVGEGDDHTILGSDKFYEEGSAGVTFVEWVRSMIGDQNGISWDNVACEGCMDLCQ